MSDAGKIDTVHTRSIGEPGRALNRARMHQFVLDSSSGPGEGLTNSEAFLAGISSCGVTLIEKYAQGAGVPVSGMEVEISGIRSRGRSRPVPHHRGALPDPRGRTARGRAARRSLAGTLTALSHGRGRDRGHESRSSERGRAMKRETRLIHAGRDPEKHFGIVNPPVYRASTVLFPTMEEFERRGELKYTGFFYGIQGTPTTFDLTDALAELSGAHRAVVTSSGYSAITLALVPFLRQGDHLLVADTVYAPTRAFCTGMLARFGVETTFYDPHAGAAIGAADAADHEGRVRGIARRRRRSRSRTSRRSRGRRMNAARSSCSTIRGRRRSTSARSSTAWMSRSRRRPSTSADIRT